RSGPLVLAAAVAALAAELYALHLLVNLRGQAGTALAIHAAVATALIGLTLALRRRRGLLAAAFLTVVTVLTGPFGPAMHLLAAIGHAWFRRDATPFEQWYAALFPDEEDDAMKLLFERIAAGGDRQTGSVTSFADIIRLGSRDQKEAAIALMAHNFRPAFAPALHLALQDPSPAVRVQAATASAEIENSYTERAIALAAAERRRPGDPAAVLALARHYEDYANCGLLDADRERENRSKALALYRSLAEAAPNDLALASAVGRNLMRLGQVAEATHWLALGIDPRAPAPQLLAWLVECLYRLRRTEELQAILIRHRELLLGSPDLPESLRAAIALWLPAEAAGRAA
ncbi:MAG: hypothetical protein LDL44_08390, partial [Caenispirillum sp.]|nr:hypothetical protein [Caenispirillum sp.]